ncbi:MAG: hypothetical protein ACRDKJ_02965 [Actinomycetota bacterium]
MPLWLVTWSQEEVRMDWRREDWAYAGGTFVAAALVAYLVAGNFGLVRIPFAPPDIDGTPVRVPALAASSTDTSLPGPIEVTTFAPTEKPSGAATQLTDVTAPTAAIESAGGATISVTKGSTVEGHAVDLGSGIGDVVAIFNTASGGSMRVPATLECPNADRLACSWSAPVPDVVGSYTVTAEVTDREGNIGLAEAKDVTVVNLGKVVEDLTGGLAQTLTAVGGLLGGLLG